MKLNPQNPILKSSADEKLIETCEKFLGETKIGITGYLDKNIDYKVKSVIKDESLKYDSVVSIHFQGFEDTFILVFTHKVKGVLYRSYASGGKNDVLPDVTKSEQAMV